VVGYKISDGSAVFDSGAIGHFPDGTGVIVSKNALNGRIIVNGEDGTVSLIDPHGAPGNAIVIARDAAQRGDYVAADRSNGTLLLDYSTEVARLSCGANCSIGTPPPAIPEPSSLWFLGLALPAWLWRNRPRG
jgi:hypothetical protein